MKRVSFDEEVLAKDLIIADLYGDNANDVDDDATEDFGEEDLSDDALAEDDYVDESGLEDDEDVDLEEIEEFLKDPNVQQQQAKHKSHPVSTAFAQKARVIKEYKSVDKEFADMAASMGYPNIKTAREYLQAIKAVQNAGSQPQPQPQQQRQVQPQQKQSTTSTKLTRQRSSNQVRQQKQPLVDEGARMQLAEIQLRDQVTAFNSQYGQNLEHYSKIHELPNGQQVLRYMTQHSLTLSEAYKLVNGDPNVQKRAKDLQKNGHNHMRSDNLGGEVSDSRVSKRELEAYKSMFDGEGLTDKQLIKMIKEDKAQGYTIT